MKAISFQHRGSWSICPAGRLSVCALLCMFALLTGCTNKTEQFFSNPIGGIVDAVTSESPSQVARAAVHPASDPDRKRRAIALLSAAKWGGEAEYLRLYRYHLEENYPDATVQAACVNALGRHGNADDVQMIARLLNHDSDLVRWEAATALQRIHNPAAEQPLIRAVMQDKEPDVRMAAAKALGQYPSNRVFATLVGALNDGDFGAVHHAHQSLVLLTGHDLGANAGPWLQWQKSATGHLFDNQQPYVWQPFDKPPTLLEKAQFWKERKPVLPRPPTGMTQQEPADDEQTSPT